MTKSTEAGVLPIGSRTVRILIPSRRQDGAIVDPDLRREWHSRACRELEIAPFGGSTPMPVIGSFVHEDGRTTREEITILSSNCEEKTLRDEEARQRILRFAKELCRALGQESIFVGWGDTAYVVSEVFELDSVRVVRFAQLSPEAQLKNLTMGWGGIDQPSKVVQILSLDGWRPTTALDTDDPQLVGILQEPDGVRRAWASKLGATALTKALKGHGDTTERPTSGDLVFFPGRPGSIEVGLVAGHALSGHRDLRVSHGRMNPVTRQLLLRMLKREWVEFERDLRQRPLTVDFFPKLRKLQRTVEAEFERQGIADDGFRESVLVVGRMMFLRFLAQKGWLPGGVDALVGAFEQHRGAFFDSYIRPLWFDVLNTPVDQRNVETRRVFANEFPYLNGGLFQPRPGETELRLSDSIFDPEEPGSFLQLFRDFEFSLNEYAGSDDTLRVDPSLFGKVLETFNTHQGKKDKGVHYTPKPIAWALALEAILERLAHLTGIERERLDELSKGKRTLDGREASMVSRSLTKLRIVDPAVGSGVLLWACLEAMLMVDSACEAIINGGDGYHRGSHRWGERGRDLVCHCLYGVDISEEAVELTRLRLWLAVALSEDAPQLLPDLELNITRGDSILPSEVDRADGMNKGEMLRLPFDEQTRLANEHIRAMQAYLTAGSDDPVQQRRLRAEVLDWRGQLATQGSTEASTDLPFDWDLAFPHVFDANAKGGFDVVIANPPYVRVQNVDKKLRPAYTRAWSTLRKGNADLSFAFVELALSTLAAPDAGQVAFIQPNFRQLDAAEGVRKVVLGRERAVSSLLRLWVDFDDQQVFPTATNYVALLFAERRRRARRQRKFSYSTPRMEDWRENDDIAWLRPEGRTHSHPAKGEWLTLPTALRTAVRKAKKRLPQRLEEVVNIDCGVQTSADAVFLFSQVRSVDRKTVEVQPKSSSRWIRLEAASLRLCQKGSSSETFHLLFPYDGKGQLLSAAWLARRFPLAWKHLSSQRKKLEKREKNKFKDEAWYRFGRAQGFEACQKPKIIVPALMNTPVAIIDAKGKIAFTASGKGGGGAWALTPKDRTLTLDQIAAIMRSEEAWNHIRAYGSPQKGGWKGVDAGVLGGIPCARS